MHDKLESPTVEPSAFDTQQFKQQLLDHVKAACGTDKIGGQDFIQGLVKTAFEALLEAEMAEHLGMPLRATAAATAATAQAKRRSAAAHPVHAEVAE